MPIDVDNQLVLLPKMSKQQLLRKWTTLYKQPPPPRLRKNLMVRVLTYRIQEQAYGGLSTRTRKRLRDLAAAYNSNSRTPYRIAARIKPGTRLIREWQGKTHEVTVAEGSYEYRGSRYSSLSEIARLITFLFAASVVLITLLLVFELWRGSILSRHKFGLSPSGASDGGLYVKRHAGTGPVRQLWCMLRLGRL